MNDVTYAEQQQLTPTMTRHQHEHWEVFSCTRGSGSLLLDDGVHAFREGDVVAIPPETPHCLICPAGADCILLHMVNATLTFHDLAIIQDDENRSLQHLFQDVHYLFHSTAAYREALLPGYGQLIAQHISSRRTASPHSQVVDEIVKSIMQNYANPHYELEETLRSAPYCYDYLCRIFRQAMHTTPSKYLADLRMQSAADMLRSGTGSSISEVSRMCGFQDPLYFSRMFKKKYGVSPRAYSRTAEKK